MKKSRNGPIVLGKKQAKPPSMNTVLLQNTSSDSDRLVAMLKRDNIILRQIVPAHLIIVGCQQLRKIDGELRPDMVQNLEKSIATAMVDLDMLSISRLAKRCDEIVQALLDDIAPEKPTDIVLAGCLFILRLVDEGLAPDPGGQPTLFALSIKAEAEENQKWWKYDEAYIRGLTDRMMQRAKLLALIH